MESIDKVTIRETCERLLSPNADYDQLNFYILVRFRLSEGGQEFGVRQVYRFKTSGTD